MNRKATLTLLGLLGGACLAQAGPPRYNISPRAAPVYIANNGDWAYSDRVVKTNGQVVQYGFSQGWGPMFDSDSAGRPQVYRHVPGPYWQQTERWSEATGIVNLGDHRRSGILKANTRLSWYYDFNRFEDRTIYDTANGFFDITGEFVNDSDTNSWEFYSLTSNQNGVIGNWTYSDRWSPTTISSSLLGNNGRWISLERSSSTVVNGVFTQRGIGVTDVRQDWSSVGMYHQRSSSDSIIGVERDSAGRIVREQLGFEPHMIGEEGWSLGMFNNQWHVWQDGILTPFQNFVNQPLPTLTSVSMDPGGRIFARAGSQTIVLMPTATPEPSGIAALGLGLLLLRRTRKNG